MNKNLMPFAFDDALVRVYMDKKDEPWFVAMDVCKVLTLGNVGEAVRNLEDDEKITITNPDGNPRHGIPHQMILISESGLYSLIFRSRKNEARRFRKWVTNEVLPSIRKSGRYTLDSFGSGDASRLCLEDLPPDVRALRPRLRERSMDFALQVARTSGLGDIEAVHALFIDYCRIIGGVGKKKEVSESYVPIHEFVKTQLTPLKGGRLYTSNIYKAFSRWWKDRYKDQVPSQKMLGSVLSEYYKSRKSNTMLCRDVAFTEDIHAQDLHN